MTTDQPISPTAKIADLLQEIMETSTHIECIRADAHAEIVSAGMHLESLRSEALGYLREIEAEGAKG